MNSAVNEVTPYVLLGESRRRALVRALEQIVVCWRKKWCGEDQEIAVTLWDEVAEQGVVLGTSGTVEVSGRGVDGNVVLRLEAPTKLMCALVDSSMRLPTASHHSGSLERDLVGWIVRSLCLDVLQAARVTGPLTEVQESLPRKQGVIGDARTSAFRLVRIRLGQAVECRAQMHLSLLDALAPRPISRERKPLDSRQRSISDECLGVEAWLGDAEVNLQELAMLACGDVIVLQQALTEPGHLATEKGARIAKILLGSSGTRRAVSVAALGDQ